MFTLHWIFSAFSSKTFNVIFPHSFPFSIRSSHTVQFCNTAIDLASSTHYLLSTNQKCVIPQSFIYGIISVSPLYTWKERIKCTATVYHSIRLCIRILGYIWLWDSIVVFINVIRIFTHIQGIADFFENATSIHKSCTRYQLVLICCFSISKNQVGYKHLWTDWTFFSTLYFFFRFLYIFI